MGKGKTDQPSERGGDPPLAGRGTVTEVWNRSMKRILAVIMAALVLASLAACGNGSQAETTEAGSAAQERKESEESASAAGAPIPNPQSPFSICRLKKWILKFKLNFNNINIKYFII